MLGEQLGEEHGQVTGTRVLPGTGQGVQVEVSFQANGSLAGVQASDLGTYVTSARPDGSLFGEGQGLIRGAGGELAEWKGQGIGRSTGQGMATQWRGTIFYQTASQKLARLNGVAAVFEFDVEEDGKTHAKLWEWK